MNNINGNYNINEIFKEIKSETRNAMADIARKTINEFIPKKEYNKKFGKINKKHLEELLVHIQEFTYFTLKENPCIGDILKSIEDNDYLWKITKDNNIFLLNFIDYALPKLTEAYKQYKKEKKIMDFVSL
ncbi:hypothetical protein JW949_01410 [Candidatus Woesearchaeota archaeon]|nr:hypothetical protein [Candidatus Woesearchaeota archaeon]